MKMAVIALSVDGADLALKIQGFYPRARIFVPSRLREKASGSETFEGRLKQFVGTIFHRYDALVMVMAVGIAVRVSAPYLQSKAEDPAVVVVDDTGRFAVSLLSGHLGGANDLADQIGELLGAVPVITTSTDRHGVMAFDLLARKLGWSLENLPALKKVSAAQIEGKPVLVCMDAGINLDLPDGCIVVKSGEEISSLGTVEEGEGSPAAAVIISNRKTLPSLPEDLPYLILRPRNITAGIGCRRGVSTKRILAALKLALEEADREGSCLCRLATAYVKKNEPGIRIAAAKLRVPLSIIKMEEIREVEDRFSASSFVRKQVGVTAVAEPCAYLGSSGGKVILEKRSYNGITISLAEQKRGRRL